MIQHVGPKYSMYRDFFGVSAPRISNSDLGCPCEIMSL